MAQEQGVLKQEYQNTRDPRVKLRGDVYWARFMLNGIYVQRSLKTKSFKVALELVEKIHIRILTQGSDKDLKVSLFKDAWPKFLKDKEIGVYTKKARPRTLKEYVEFGNRYFIDFFGPYQIEKINTDVFTEYVQHIQETRGDIKMFNHEKYLRGFFSWAVAKDLISKKPTLYNPDTLRPGSEDDEGIGKSLADEEIERLKENLEGFHLGFKVYVKCALVLGMRSSEITQLKKDRIDWSSGFIRLKRSDTKTKQQRDIAIHSSVIDELKTYSESNESDYLYPNREDIDRPMERSGFKRLWEQLRVAASVDCRFHDLRHTCATKLFSDPKRNPIAICRHLGMSMRVAEKHYIHLNEETLKSVMEGFKV